MLVVLVALPLVLESVTHLQQMEEQQLAQESAMHKQQMVEQQLALV